MEQIEQSKSTGPVALDDVLGALGDMGVSPHRTNAASVREKLGRGSLSTIQKHLDALRRQQGAAEGVDTAQDEIVAPEAPKGLLRGIWESAYGLALATIQDKLIVAQERIAELERIRQSQCDEIEAMSALVDQAEAERDQAVADARAARDAQARAEAARDDALRLRDKIDSLLSAVDAIKF